MIDAYGARNSTKGMVRGLNGTVIHRYADVTKRKRNFKISRNTDVTSEIIHRIYGQQEDLVTINVHINDTQKININQNNIHRSFLSVSWLIQTLST